MRTRKILAIAVVLTACALSVFAQTVKPGTYTGYAWRGESKGIPFKDATGYIVCKITLDDKGVITAARMNVLTMHGANWVERSNPESMVTIDYTVDPTPAILGTAKANGASMFKILTTDKMGFWAAGVSDEGIGALCIVDAALRYQFEFKFPAKFDYLTKFGDLKIGTGGAVPTTFTEDGIVAVKSWDDFKAKSILGSSQWNHVITSYGIFKGLSDKSTVREYLERVGIAFDKRGRPQPKSPVWGFHSMGGWDGNYKAIAKYLVGKDATKMSSLVDWSIERYAKGVNAKNFFGVDVVSGGTRTVQNSIDTIAGATIRMSRESSAYQRALVDAGLLEEKDVIKGRY